MHLHPKEARAGAGPFGDSAPAVFALIVVERSRMQVGHLFLDDQAETVVLAGHVADEFEGRARSHNFCALRGEG